MSGGIIAQIAVGRYVLQIGDPCGAVITEALRADQSHFRPRPMPILLQPRMIRGLLDRQTELAAAFSALDAGLPVEVSGERGVGKTAVLRHLAHHPRAASFVDGIVYLSARHHTLLDLQQLLFEAFYESDPSCKPTESEIRHGLQEKRALILLDDVRLTQDELEQLIDIAPRAAFVVATRKTRRRSEVRSLALKGLPIEDAVSLLEREIERSLDVAERSDAATLCAAIGAHPRRILQAAALIREQGISLDQCAQIITQSPVVNLMASIDNKQRRALMALAALPGVPLQPRHVSAIAEVTDIEPSLTALVRRGLVVSTQSRYHLADGVIDRLRRTEDLNPWTNRVITYFSAWAERHLRSQDILLQESEALLRVQQRAADGRRSGEVLRLGRLLEGPLAAGARWGAWGITLEGCLTAARAIGDRSAEAWALHQLGSRAFCLGDAGPARASLNQAVKLREMLNEAAAAAASRRNLSFVLPPVPESPPERVTTSLVDVLELDALPLRHATPPAISNPKTHSASGFLAAVVLFAILGGLAYWNYSEGLSLQSRDLASISAFVQTSLERVTARLATMRTVQRAAHDSGLLNHDEPVVDSSGSDRAALATEVPLTEPQPQAPPTDRASILIFTPRPGSIAMDGPTRLCYAVSDALQVRLEPQIGEVAPTRTLTCLRVAPTQTTTYQLTAYGRDGHQVSQQLVIVVR
jgi:hypothetical protein